MAIFQFTFIKDNTCKVSDSVVRTLSMLVWREASSVASGVVQAASFRPINGHGVLLGFLMLSFVVFVGVTTTVAATVARELVSSVALCRECGCGVDMSQVGDTF